MARDPECIFCKILEGDIPAYKLFEDEHTFAFMDINPLNDGHALIIPKDHHPNIFDTPTNVLAPLMETTQRIARAIQNSIAPDGINILQANGHGAAQSVFHVHFHVLPRKNGDDAKLNWGLRPGDMDHISDLAQQIRVAIKD
ncbi:MAG: HIT family protein [Alphaproteobacteria bacterium]|nr:HIT family protein [Alphaproteobacteria bacterium]MBT4019884.1 HIT family protein [Alphaproteobacteria bacterium]MBT4965770.1 HIT family protein [Alphaproteobacteria bacterium]MBT5917625.1 HIT family protein [Alphaproteobacteria bacterium]MBT7747406.1 HIT family protein [Alphaproteobacteria bacterium]